MIHHNEEAESKAHSSAQAYGSIWIVMIMLLVEVPPTSVLKRRVQQQGRLVTLVFEGVFFFAGGISITPEDQIEQHEGNHHKRDTN
jgi:hypothetical protein